MVDVTAAVAVETSSTTLTGVVNGQADNDLPMNGRDFGQMLKLLDILYDQGTRGILNFDGTRGPWATGEPGDLAVGRPRSRSPISGGPGRNHRSAVWQPTTRGTERN